jgi:hypothetical protein
MAITSPDSIYYPDSTSQIAPLETHFAQMANSVQTALAVKQTYTPTVTGITLGNGTVTATSARSGLVIVDEIVITLGSTSSVTGAVTVSNLPVASTVTAGMSVGSVTIIDFGTASYLATALSSTSTAITVNLVLANGTYATANGAISSTAPMTWAVSDKILISTQRIIA